MRVTQPSAGRDAFHCVPFLPLLLFFLFCYSTQLLAERRFPPPEFESGYQLPATATPAPRANLLESLDVAVLVAALGLATWLTLKKRSRKGVAALSLFSLAYFGFYREGCVCAIGSIQNIALGLADRTYAVPLTVTAFFVAPLVFTLFAGRGFCSSVCPHGALQDLFLLKPIRVPSWLEQGLGLLAYVYLGAAVLFAATGSAFLICRYDPFVPLFRLTGSFEMLAVGAGFLLIGLFIGRPYCRFLCPYGALLRLASKFAKWRVTVTPDVCTRCQLCANACPFGALQEPSPPDTSRQLALDRRRLGWFLIALPLLIFLCGWLGSKLSVPASRMHPTVALAERVLTEKPKPVQTGSAAVDDLALSRGALNAQEILSAAVSIRRQFLAGSWLLGGWIGLVLGAKLTGLSLRQTRTGYEPDPGACVACARCFAFCPNERARCGLPALAPAGVEVKSDPPSTPVSKT